MRISGKIVSEYYPRSFSELIRGKPPKIKSRKLVSINDNRLKNGTPVGKCEYFWITGGLREVHYYNEDGKQYGPYEMYYGERRNFQLWRRGNYKNGVQDGLLEEFYEKGQLRHRGNYKNGREDGLWESYYENGQLREKTVYKNGLIEGTSEDYFDNGQLHSKTRYKDGLEMDVESYYKNGQLELKYKKKIDRNEYSELVTEYHGSYKSFYKNGKPKQKLNYEVGYKKGLQETYYKNGKIHIRGMVNWGVELHGKFHPNMRGESKWEFFNRKGQKMWENTNERMLKGWDNGDYDKSENKNVEWFTPHPDF